MDPMQLRLTNLMRDGAITHTRQKIDRVLAVDCLKAVVNLAGWDEGVPNRHGSKRETRKDIGKSGVRGSCTLGTHLNCEDIL